MSTPKVHQSCEFLIVGGGPAGQAAALVAARAQRRVIVVDGGSPRNAAAPAIHGYLSRDGVLPADFRRTSHEQLAAYEHATHLTAQVDDITGECDAFVALLADGRQIEARRVLLATGLVDILPDIPGLEARWGHGVHHCPYCDGHEHRQRRWGVVGNKPSTIEFAMFLRGWTPTVTIFTLGHEPHAEAAEKLQRSGVVIEVSPVARILATGPDYLDAVELTDGRRVPIESLWLRPAQRQDALTARLALPVDDDGAIVRDARGETSTPGLFVAGDLAAGSTQQALQAAADGARVAMAINHELILQPLAGP